MDRSNKRHPALSMSGEETNGWCLSLLTLPVRDQPLSLVVCLAAATLFLSSGLTGVVLQFGRAPERKSGVSLATARLPIFPEQPAPGWVSH